jgi:hypothetical protein
VRKASKPGRPAPARYKRFKTVAAAVRFAVEQLSSDLLKGASLEVGDLRTASNIFGLIYKSEGEDKEVKLVLAKDA